MYKKDTTDTLDTGLARAGAVLFSPPTGAIPKKALVALCDGCGAQVWLDPALKATLDAHELTNRTFCSNCLKVRQVL